ncbi:MAG: hypothetical protein H7X71_00470 [Chitinophagales bacterium]|nr:hypothetical protein [Chitinophagales bacterium]
MKNNFLHTLVLVSVITFQVSASNNKSVNERLENPIMVVFDANDAEYNQYVKYAVENYWTLNSYIFMPASQFENAKMNSDNVFLMKAENQSAKDEGTTVYEDVMQLVYFIKKGKLVTQVAGTPIVKDDMDSKNTVINGVRVLQDKLQFIVYKEEKEASENTYAKNVESRSDIVKLKKLYIAAEDLDETLSLNDIVSMYEGEIFLVSRDELNKLIDSKSPDILFAVVFNRKTSNVSYVNTKQIVSANSGEVIYKDETTSVKPQGFTKRDIRDLAE